MARIRQIALPWTQQPQNDQPASTRWIGRGLRFLATRELGVNRVSGRSGTRTASSGTQVITPTPSGIGSVFSGGYALVSYAQDDVPVTTAGATIVLLANPVDIGSSAYALYQTTTNSSSLAFGANFAHDGSYAANNLAFVLIDATVPVRVSIVASGAIDGGMHCWVVRKAQTGTVWCDGQQVSSTTTGSMGVNGFGQSSGDAAFVGCKDDSGAFVFGANIVALAAFGAALTDDECASLSANPWQMFEPSRSYVPAAVAGALTLQANGSLLYKPAASGGDAKVYLTTAGALVAKSAPGAGDRALSLEGGNWLAR